MNKHQLLLALNGLEHWLLDGSEEARLGLKEDIDALKEKIKAELACSDSENGRHHWVTECLDCGEWIDEDGLVPMGRGA